MHLSRYYRLIIAFLRRIMAYIPRTSTGSTNSDGSPVTPAWDPYSQYVLDVDLFDGDGYIKVDLLHSYTESATGVPAIVQTAIDVAHDDVEALALDAKATALSALSFAATGVANAEAAAAAAAASASDAAALATAAADSADAALALGTGAVGSAVEAYLADTTGLVDDDGKLAQWRTPDPFGGIITNAAIGVGTRGGIFLYQHTSAYGFDTFLELAASSAYGTVWEIINMSTYALAFAPNGSDNLKLLDGTAVVSGLDIAVSGGRARIMSDGVDTYYVLENVPAP